MRRRPHQHGRSGTSPAPRRKRPPRRPYVTRPSSGPGIWTQASMPGDARRSQKGLPGWVARDTMICDLPEHRKAQPNHPDLVGPPLEYMHDRQVFEGIHLDIYDLCRFYTLGMTGDPPEFPAPWKSVIREQIQDLLKSAHATGQPYLILAHSADLVMAVLLLRELHTTTCLRQLQVNLWGKLVKLSFCPFCTYVGGNDLSYLNHMIIAHYNVSYGC